MINGLWNVGDKLSENFKKQWSRAGPPPASWDLRGLQPIIPPLAWASQKPKLLPRLLCLAEEPLALKFWP